ncbi:thioredoxin domain-containing protein [Apibacter sp. B2912]|uniref:thioredoxin domain-containing protein n=1 Tax=Apibacter sp. B2912 TaxID=2656763 RepID=UPI0013684432|nr:thioredoxin domain-containing protein [Apibacter sp. B2912]MXO32260.1 redoxin domain-containing protein [Apibacter sp. B2912]
MKKIILTINLLFGWYISAQVNSVLEPKDFLQKLKNSNSILIDVRTPEEFETGHIKNAIDLDYRNASFSDKIRKLDTSKTYMIYCRSGKRSASTVDSLKNLGFTHLYDLKGGINAWKTENLPVVGEAEDKISKEEFKKMISSDRIVLIDFYAPWCGPCLKMEPMFKNLAEKYRNKVKIIKINSDENKNLAKPYIKDGFPKLIAYKNQKTQWEKVGLIDEEDLIQSIEKLIN